jgi:hypothetical protein
MGLPPEPVICDEDPLSDVVASDLSGTPRVKKDAVEEDRDA